MAKPYAELASKALKLKADKKARLVNYLLGYHDADERYINKHDEKFWEIVERYTNTKEN